MFHEAPVVSTQVVPLDDGQVRAEIGLAARVAALLVDVAYWEAVDALTLDVVV